MTHNAIFWKKNTIKSACNAIYSFQKNIPIHEIRALQLILQAIWSSGLKFGRESRGIGSVEPMPLLAWRLKFGLPLSSFSYPTKSDWRTGAHNKGC